MEKKTVLLKTWREMIDKLYDDAKERIEEALEGSDSHGCDTDEISEDVSLIGNLNTLSYKLDEYEVGSIKYEDLASSTKFLKEKMHYRELLVELLDDMYGFEETKYLAESMESIISIVFG